MMTLKKTTREPKPPFVLYESDDPFLKNIQADFAAPLKLAHAGNGYDWIAAELKIPLGTVKSRISRARRQILRMRFVAAQGDQQLEGADD